MFTIGDFARHGRVSVRMLRHYDATGLLRPARVDPASGYRFYAASQLARLNRIVALKDLGFTLEQVRTMLDEQVSAGQLRVMLRLRQAELQAQIAADDIPAGAGRGEAPDHRDGGHHASRRHPDQADPGRPGRAAHRDRGEP